MDAVVGVFPSREAGERAMQGSSSSAYSAAGGNFARDEPIYHRGFEAACSLVRAGASYADVIVVLRANYPDVCEDEAFRQGFARGRAHLRARDEQRRAA